MIENARAFIESASPGLSAFTGTRRPGEAPTEVRRVTKG